jgi:DNA helicase-2/ATP-dependent DNA helicase PcrA
MPDVQPPPATKVAGKSKKAKALDQGVKPARKRAQPNPVAVSVPYVSAFAIGDRIWHPQFGEGTVTAIDDAKLTIAFASRGTKQIIDYYVERYKAA